MRALLSVLSLAALLLAGAALALRVPAAPPPGEGMEPGPTHRVVAAEDGDTVVLDDGTEVRLVGLQAPKLPLGRPGFEAWPLAHEAHDTLADLVEGRTVTLWFGGLRQDRYGRWLAHLVHDDGLWIQGAMLDAGMARVYTFPDNRTMAQDMLDRERAARDRRAGIWASDWYTVQPAGGDAGPPGSFQLVEGTVVDAARVRGTVYLNFGADWRTDFTARLDRTAQELFAESGLDPLSLEGRPVRVRGWIDRYNGPMVDVTHPEQIEVLE